jgi:hypothetical protein
VKFGRLAVASSSLRAKRSNPEALPKSRIASSPFGLLAMMLQNHPRALHRSPLVVMLGREEEK